MYIHISRSVQKNCWNFHDSFGEICVGCGCCSKDKKERYESRIRCLEYWLKEQLEFDGWTDGWREIQEENIKANIRYYKRRLRYYRQKIAELKDGERKDGDGE